MVRVNIKNIYNILDNEQNINSNKFVHKLMEKSKNDLNFEKFLYLVLKYNLLIFEKQSNWIIKDISYINSLLQKLIKSTYDDHLINLSELSSINMENYIDVKNMLDKLNNNIKKKLLDLYELKSLLESIDISIIYDKIDKVIKKKKIINNDIYIEEFSN